MIVALVAVALVAGGCEYLQALAVTPVAPVAAVPSADPGMPAPSIDSNGPSDAPPSADPDDPGFSFDPDATDAPPKAYFKHGSATLTIGKQVIKLDKMVGQGFLSEQFGAQAAWTNGSGWYAQAFGISPPGSEYGEDALVSFDHIVNGQHWTVGDPSLCHIAVTRSDEKGLAGTATCPSSPLGGSHGGLREPDRAGLCEGRAGLRCHAGLRSQPVVRPVVAPYPRGRPVRSFA